METQSNRFFDNLNYNFDPETAPIIAGWELNTPSNMGNVIRLAHNIGVKKVFFVNNDPSKRDSSIKKTAGMSFDKIDWEFCSPDGLFRQIPDHYIPIAIETANGSQNIFTTQLPTHSFFIVGSERYGLPETVLHQCNQYVHIPMTGGCPSMNVSHALAVCLFEWQRQQVFR